MKEADAEIVLQKAREQHPDAKPRMILELWHRTLIEQALRPKTPLTLEDARRIVAEFVDHYNNVRLHSAIGYIALRDKLED